MVSVRVLWCCGDLIVMSSLRKVLYFLHFFILLPMRNQTPLTCSLGDWSYFHGSASQNLSRLLTKKTLSSFYPLCIYKIRALFSAKVSLSDVNFISCLPFLNVKILNALYHNAKIKTRVLKIPYHLPKTFGKIHVFVDFLKKMY